MSDAGELRPERPLPAPDDLTRPFWEAAAGRRLVLQCCRECGRFQFPPQPLCDTCASPALEWRQVSGRGRVYTYTINHQRSVAGFENVVPYVNLVVELDEQPLLLMVSDLPHAEAPKVRIGGRVEVTFEPLSDEIVLPRFALCE